jgi:lipopolysaccharide biosynthesis glycosyltransferase
LKDGRPPKFGIDPSKSFHLLDSGLVILTPSVTTFNSIQNFLETSPLVPNFSSGDGDLLATLFKGRVIPISYIYNGLKTVRSYHKDLWKDEQVKNIHYPSSDKPWEERPKIGEENEYLHVL